MDENAGPRHHGGPGALSAAAASRLDADFSRYEPISRATSPGIPCAKPEEDDKKRYRQRTFAYFQQLPFAVEAETERDQALQEILKQLYIAIKADDFSPGALHWTRELYAWLNLKFEMTRELRAELAQLYYSLCLTPGLDNSASERFLRMVLSLTRSVAPHVLVCDDARKADM
jgi:proteasome activator subunit 4